MRSTGVFVDGSNFHATTTKLRANVDFDLVIDYFKKWQPGSLYRAFYFTALPERNTEGGNIHKLTDHLDYNGWALIQKPMKTMIDSEGKVKKKGNMDCELIIHAVEAAPFINDFVLFSGDGDFKELIIYLQRRGIRCHVFSSIKAGMVADELRRQADDFIELENFLDVVERDDVRASRRG